MGKPIDDLFMDTEKARLEVNRLSMFNVAGKPESEVISTRMEYESAKDKYRKLYNLMKAKVMDIYHEPP